MYSWSCRYNHFEFGEGPEGKMEDILPISSYLKFRVGAQILKFVVLLSLGWVKIGLGSNFKDGLNEGEGVGVGVNFQQKIICDPEEKGCIRRILKTAGYLFLKSILFIILILFYLKCIIIILLWNLFLLLVES